MFTTSDRASFLIIFFWFLQYYVFVVLSGDVFALFQGIFIATPSPEKKIAYQTFLCTQRPFGNYWASTMFSGPDFIANLSDGLKIKDPVFITCDEIAKLHFVTSLKHLKQLFGHFNPMFVLLISQQMWHPSSKILSDFQMLLQNKVNC